jgi:hypothetical protein
VTRDEHTQIGHVIVWSLLGIILIASGGLIGSSSHRGPPVVVSIILLICLVLFYRLTITIEDETLWASFGPGIIRKKVRLAEIVGCEAIRIRWWYGCDGKEFTLGTDDPHGQTAGIRHAIRVD